jgi:uncharacterized membrane protein
MIFRNDKNYKVALVVLILLYVSLFSFLAFLRCQSFFSYEWEDQAEINRVLWGFSRGSITDLIQNYMPEGVYYKFHTAFFLYFLAFFYNVYPHPGTLFVLTALALGVTAFPLFLIAKRLFQSGHTAFMLAVAYLLYAPKHNLNFLDGDPIIFLVPLLAMAFYAALTGRTLWLVICLIFSLTLKTEAPLFVIMFTVYLFYQRRKGLQVSGKTCLFLLLSALAFLLMNFFLYGRFSTGSMFSGFYNGNLPGAMAHGAQKVIALMSSAHGWVWVQLFAPVLFFPLFSIELYIGLPSLVLVFLTQDFVFQRAHYLAGLMPFVFIGTIYVLKRLSERPRLQSLFITLIFSGCFLSNFGHNILGTSYPPKVGGAIADTRFISAKNIFDPRFYAQDDGDRIAWKMIGMIPENASVSVSGDLMVPLSSRQRVFEFLDRAYDYYNVDFILIHNKNMYLGAGRYEWSDTQMKEELELLLRRQDWSLVSREGDYYLFRRDRQSGPRKKGA